MENDKNARRRGHFFEAQCARFWVALASLIADSMLCPQCIRLSIRHRHRLLSENDTVLFTHICEHLNLCQSGVKETLRLGRDLGLLRITVDNVKGYEGSEFGNRGPYFSRICFDHEKNRTIPCVGCQSRRNDITEALKGDGTS